MTPKLYADDDLLSLSGIQHFRFCKRQWALIHIERQWEDNLRTQEGHFEHERVNDPFFNESRGDVLISRSFPLVSNILGLYGIADIIEYTRAENGIPVTGHGGLWLLKPIEYKRGRPKIDERDEVQLCAQVMCLEEMFCINIAKADFYYAEVRRRHPITITNDLRDLVRSLAREMHELFKRGKTPEAEQSKNCSLCSLIDICLPRLTKKKKNVRNYIEKHVLEASRYDL